MDSKPLLVLTGRTRAGENGDEILTIIHDKHVWFPIEEFRVLVDLVLSVSNPGATVEVPGDLIQSMRQRIDAATGTMGLGASIIAGPFESDRN